MTKTIPDAYIGREQTYLKHLVLKEYLRAWSQKLGSLSQREPITLFYVDCFAGPWESASEGLGDTSVVIGLRAIAEAFYFWQSTKQMPIRVKAIFVEKSKKSFAKLQSYLKDHAPPSVESIALLGTFAEHVDEISASIGNNPAFLFVDPKGWKGVGMEYVARLASGPRRDILVNVMYDFINRFKGDERAFLRDQLKQFFGLEEAALSPELDEEALMAEYRERLKARALLGYVADVAIPHPTSDRTYFRLVVGGGHPAVVKLFRKIEENVCGKVAGLIRQEAKRGKRESTTGQLELGVETPALDVRYANMKQKGRRDAEVTILETIRLHGPRRFAELWPAVLERHHVTHEDVKGLVQELASRGLLVWRKASPSTRVPQDGDVLSLPG